jgi:C4-dicarboxylate-specific signal transduction histidine kinase
MPWVEQLSDPNELRRCIRDLVALSTLPAMWQKYDPHQIADSVAAALLSMLHADLVFTALPGRSGAPPIEIVRTGKAIAPHLSAAIGAAMRAELPAPAVQQILDIANPLGEGMLRLACAPIGFGGDAVVVVGARHLEFPTDVQRLLLRIAANEAAIALQRWQMEAEQHRFASLIERSSDFVGVASLDGRPQYINPSATVSRDLTAPKRLEAQLRQLAEMLEQRVAERTTELAEANQRLVAEIAERERSDARVQQLQLEFFHAARLNAAGQLAAALAHELNQPLTAATNSVNAARRRLGKIGHPIDGKVAEAMNDAADQTLRAGQIIRRLRDFVARGETEKRIENVPAMIEDASALALTGARALGVQVQFRFDPLAPRAVVDRIQIQQVLINLMRNALEALAGSDRRTLEVRTRLLDGETVEIVVADSGPGLTRSVADRLFEPFVSTKRNGMGLGLSICRSIVEAHGGQLRASSGPDGGAVFRFTVAAAPADGDIRAG